MTALVAHTRTLLHTLDPRQPSAPSAWIGVAGGASGLALAAHGSNHPEFGVRLFSALFMLGAVGGFSTLRQAIRSPASAPLPPLPLGQVSRHATELFLYVLVILVGAVPLVLLGALSLAHVYKGLPPAPASWDAALTNLGAALALLLPMLVATTPMQHSRGPMALLRLLLPWLPAGVSATAGWLAHAPGVLATVAAVWTVALSLLAMRHTGWEAWKPSLPTLHRSEAPTRRGLQPVERLSVDLKGGLGRGLGVGLGLTASGWALFAASRSSDTWEALQVCAILAITGGFLAATWSTLRIPFRARAPGWGPRRLPWQALPLPHGAMQRAMLDHQSLVWLALGPLNAAALLLVHLGQPTNDATAMAAEITLGMLLVLLPALTAWEAIATNSQRKLRAHGHALFFLLGIASFGVALIGSTALVGTLTAEEATMGWILAAKRVLAATGLSFVLGLAWLAAGRLLAMREQAAAARGT